MLTILKLYLSSLLGDLNRSLRSSSRLGENLLGVLALIGVRLPRSGDRGLPRQVISRGGDRSLARYGGVLDLRLGERSRALG